jgi:hypothetical protein
MSAAGSTPGPESNSAAKAIPARIREAFATPPVVTALLIPIVPALIAFWSDGIEGLLVMGGVGFIVGVFLSLLWFALVAPLLLSIEAARRSRARFWLASMGVSAALAVPTGLAIGALLPHTQERPSVWVEIAALLMCGGYLGLIAGGSMVLRVRD